MQKLGSGFPDMVYTYERNALIRNFRYTDALSDNVRLRCICANGARLQQNLKWSDTAVGHAGLIQDRFHGARIEQEVARCLSTGHVLAFEQKNVTRAVGSRQERYQRVGAVCGVPGQIGVDLRFPMFAVDAC